MLIGIVSSVPVTVVAFLLARKLGAKITSALSEETVGPHRGVAPWKAFLPLILPILLIALASMPHATEPENMFFGVIETAGVPVIALAIGVALALPLIPTSHRNELPGWMADAIKDAGAILLIVGGGGAFGAVIKSSNVDVVLKNYITGSPMYGVAFLLLAFLLAAILKTAQGSTTSSMIICSSLLSPLATGAGLQSPLQVAALVMAVGGGAMTVSHVNDAYFWVISQFGKISSSDALRSYTVITLCQGITALLASIILLLVA